MLTNKRDFAYSCRVARPGRFRGAGAGCGARPGALGCRVVGAIQVGSGRPPREGRTRMADESGEETLTHRLVLPRDANHHGTLYAGVLLALALEAGYATAYRAAGASANLVLKRVLDLRCYEPVPVGRVVEIRGREIHRATAQVVVALFGPPLPCRSGPWMDSLMQFVQVDDAGRPEPLGREPDEAPLPLESPWSDLRDRGQRLLA